jgi:acyl carrier protein
MHDTSKGESQMDEPVGMHIRPHTTTEEALKTIWMDALQINNPNTCENFMDLGGDSLSAMLCISRIKGLFGVELDVLDFFSDESTVSGLAALIDRECRKNSLVL